MFCDRPRLPSTTTQYKYPEIVSPDHPSENEQNPQSRSTRSSPRNVNHSPTTSLHIPPPNPPDDLDEGVFPPKCPSPRKNVESPDSSGIRADSEVVSGLTRTVGEGGEMRGVSLVWVGLGCGGGGRRWGGAYRPLGLHWNPFFWATRTRSSTLYALGSG